MHQQNEETGLEDLLNGPPPRFKYSATTLQTKHEIDLCDVLTGDLLEYHDLFNILRRVGENDHVILRLTNFGGSCSIGYRIAREIKDCKGHVHCYVVGEAYSMGAVLALSGDSLELSPGSILMFHNYSGGAEGKGAELEMSIGNRTRAMKKLDEIFCSPFLTKRELKALTEDKDIYIHQDDDDFLKRCSRHFKAMRDIK